MIQNSIRLDVILLFAALAIGFKGRIDIETITFLVGFPHSLSEASIVNILEQILILGFMSHSDQNRLRGESLVGKSCWIVRLRTLRFWV